MASGGYYYDQSTGYGYLPTPRAMPFHLLVFLVNITLLGATSLYSRYESATESLVDQVRFAVILSPLLLLLAVKYWAATQVAAAAGRCPLVDHCWSGTSPPSTPAADAASTSGTAARGGIVVAVERGAPGRCDFNKHTCLRIHIWSGFISWALL